MIISGRDNLENFLEAILRGAAKILGCNSTNLILFNEHTATIRILIGAMAVSYPVLENIEQVLGRTFKGISLKIDSVKDSMVYQSWHDGITRETSSLSKLVGNAFQLDVTEQVARLAGDQRFICVPARTATHNYGVLLFTKEGKAPFSRQQREVLLTYARRIGEIVENDLMGERQTLFSLTGGPEYLLFDSGGALRGRRTDFGGAVEVLLSDTARLEALESRVTCFLAGAPEPASTARTLATLEAEFRLTINPLTFDGADGALCVLCQRGPGSDASLENQLLQITLGDTAPTLFVDPGLRITSCNEALEQLFGYCAAELLNKPIGILFRHPREIEDLLGHQLIDPANPYCHESTIIHGKDGSISPARVEALYLADDMHQVVGFLVVVRDSSEPGGAAGDRLLVQERLATMGELATQLAHEIRNPLVAIGATLDSMREEIDQAEHRTMLTTLSREITRMDMILKDYLSVRSDVALAEVSLADVVSAASALLEGATRTAGKKIRSDIDPDLKVVGDHDALKHVFFNLLHNALEASPGAGEVTCRVVKNTYDLAITIEDRGPGLKVAARRCFQPFFTTKKHGTGLGLSVCQNIARAHGGLVELMNREGGGCQAVVILPRRSRRMAP